MGRILGLDFGSKRTGVAISDEEYHIALPRDPIHYTAQVELYEAIELILVEDDIDEIVVGLPLAMSGEETDQTHRTREFAKRVHQLLDIPVFLEDERLTSVQADAIMVQDEGSKKEDRDTLAAQAILQSYLDRRRKERPSA